MKRCVPMGRVFVAFQRGVSVQLQGNWSGIAGQRLNGAGGVRLLHENI